MKIFRLILGAVILNGLLLGVGFAEPVTKPHTFMTGTPARAEEVNENFDVIYNRLNELTSQLESIDTDTDGFNLLLDCNDTDPDIYPGAAEYCDGKDNNCNGTVDEDCHVPCTTDADCPFVPDLCSSGVLTTTNVSCNTELQRCVESTADVTCPTSRPYCIGGAGPPTYTEYAPFCSTSTTCSTTGTPSTFLCPGSRECQGDIFVEYSAICEDATRCGVTQTNTTDCSSLGLVCCPTGCCAP